MDKEQLNRPFVTSPERLKHAVIANVGGGAAQVVISDERYSPIVAGGQAVGLPCVVPLQPIADSGLPAPSPLAYLSRVIGNARSGGYGGASYHFSTPATALEVVVVIGLPGSGKTTWIRENLPEHIRVSSDCIIRSTNKHWSSKLREFYQYVEDSMVFAALSMGHNVVIDRTNHLPETQQRWIDLADRLQAQCRMLYIKRPLQECIRLNSQREKRIPDVVIERMHTEMVIPDHAVVVKMETAK